MLARTLTKRGGGKWLVCISVLRLRVCFLVSVLSVKGGIRCALVVSSVKSGCELHIWFRHLGWADCGLLVTAFVKMSTRAVIVIPGMRASLSACAQLMVHLQTAWNPTPRIKEVRRANAVITPGSGV